MLLGLFGRRRSAPAAPEHQSLRETLLAQLRDHLGRGHLAAAEVCLDELREHFPADPEVRQQEGGLCYQRGEFAQAEGIFRDILSKRPDDAVALANLGQSLQVRGAFAEAQPLFESALRIAPGLAFAKSNLAVACYALDQTSRAVTLCRELVAADPDDPSAHFALAEGLLRLGAYAEGWSEYEWRMREPGYQRYFRRYAQATWDGSEQTGKVVLIWPEQGFGDTLQFTRLAIAAAARHGSMRFIVDAPAALARLMRNGLADNRLPNLEVAPQGKLPEFDLHVSVMSLAWRLNARLDVNPVTGPYLRADPALVEEWQRRLDAALPAGRLRVGLAWAGNRREEFDAGGRAVDFRRSLPVEMAARLTGVPDCTFVSLQVGPRAGELTAIGAQVADFGSHIADFADTAALMQCLDLVVSVDTAVVHLAGALGRPAWMLSRYDCCWRWGERATTSPWYPSLRPYYQDAPGDWRGVIERVNAALHQHAREHALRT
ncbi:MAG: tetratricopeptide repeat protein [Burkholderiales bacterium]|nr:tetratricopeptide repeat protein [Burkholderiales bacterium]